MNIDELTNIWYHGTSSIFINKIKRDGLKAHLGRVYITKKKWVAYTEADYTVYGDAINNKVGVGGSPIVIILDGKYFSDTSVKTDNEYHFHDAGYVEDDIPPNAIISIEQI